MNRLFIDNSIGEIIEKIRTKELLPRNVMGASLENINELDSKYKAWEAYRDLNWQEPNLKNPMDGPVLSGALLPHIPVGVKDIYNTHDFPTQMGSSLWKGFTPGNDARAVFNLKRQGGVVVGKTVTAEFAVHALEKTLNPWDITKTPGTSSSGSAVAVSLGQVPIATGTQTAGSIIRPASFCGVFGCKPSFGFIPRTGMLKTTDSLDTPGFFVIHQKDLRRGFDSMRISGKDYPVSDAALSDVTRQQKHSGRPWRVCFVKTHTWHNTPKYAKEAMENFIQKLSSQKGVVVSEAKLPSQMEHAHEVHETIYNKALSYYFQHEYTQANQISPIMRELIDRGEKVSLADYNQAISSQTEMMYAMDTFLKDYDVLISLSTAGEAPPREIAELPDPALMWTLTHLPVVSVPQFTSPSGLPFGMQVVARKYNDYLLFDFLEHIASLGIIPQKAGFAVSNKV